MTDAQTSGHVSTKLLKVAERARRNPEERFFSLAHLMDETLLTETWCRIRRDAAVGVDGITKEEYWQDLERNIRDLHLRLKTKRYRHQPLRRVHIPKGNGKTRPIGISATEDKIVQGALKTVLETIYEQDFLECSYGFRPGRSPHDAVRVLQGAVSRGEMNWILEADITSFFDSLDRKQLMEMIQTRVIDGSILRLIGKCLHVGVLDGEEYSEPEAGTTQGSSLSPLLGNIYLHYVLDLWFEKVVQPRLKGRSILIRYADDFVIAFESRRDAERVKEVLEKRMKKYGLTLHPEKTRLIPFFRPKGGTKGKGPATFDFLGFTWFWRRTRKGRWTVGCKTRHVRLTRAIKAVYDWCRNHRHLPVQEQHAALVRRLQGHINYFGVNGNWRSLELLRRQARKSWHKWLNRRSQRSRLNWERFEDLLKDFPLPQPRIVVQIWC